MAYTQYKNVTVAPELGIEVDLLANQVMEQMVNQGWQVISVCPHPQGGKLLVTFGK